MSTVSERLKELRISNEYTQDYIAMKMHVGRSTYTHWENGKYTPDLDRIIWLCNFYNVSADYLLGRTDFSDVEQETPFLLSENPSKYSPFTEDDTKIFNYYHRLDEENQDYIRGMMIKLYKEQISENNDMKNSDIG